MIEEKYVDDGALADVTLIKTLTAKEALAQAKTYTNEQVAALEARIAALEGTI